MRSNETVKAQSFRRSYEPAVPAVESTRRPSISETSVQFNADNIFTPEIWDATFHLVIRQMLVGHGSGTAGLIRRKRRGRADAPGVYTDCGGTGSLGCREPRLDGSIRNGGHGRVGRTPM